MKKRFSQIIDELTVTNIKIFHLVEKIEKNKHTSKDTKKLQYLTKLRLELGKALDKSIVMKKRFSQIIDELTVTNTKIFHLVDKIEKNEHTREDAKKAQDLNRYRSQLCNAINEGFKERKNVRV